MSPASAAFDAAAPKPRSIQQASSTTSPPARLSGPGSELLRSTRVGSPSPQNGGLGFRVQGLGFRVSGLGFRV